VRNAVLYLRHQRRNFYSLTLLARQHFRVFGAIFLLLNSLQMRCFSTREFTHFEIVPLSILGCDQQNLENFLSDLKWSGHRVAHIFANGSSSVLHQHKKTLLEAPTGTLLFGDKNIKQELVHTLLLEEYDVSKNWVIIMDMRQEHFDSSRKNGGPSAQD